jgi:hypothetical protein
LSASLMALGLPQLPVPTLTSEQHTCVIVVNCTAQSLNA